MGVILREIIPDGTQWGRMGDILPHWMNLEFGQDLKGPSSISFDYANDGAHFERIKGGMYVVPVVGGRHNWFDSIFYIRERTGSLMPGSTSKTTRFGGVSLRKRLDNVRWMPAIGSNYIDAEMFRYTNQTPGAIIKAGVENFWSRAKSQFGDDVPWLAGVGVSPDSNWHYRVDEVIEPTTSVNDIISKYQDLGIGTARFYGFHLNTAHYYWYTDGPSRDKTDEVQLKIGLNLENGEYEESYDNLITSLLVQGAADPFPKDETTQSYVAAWVTAPQEVIDKYGYHEDVLNVADATNPETLKAIGQNYLRKHLEPRMSRNFTMVDSLRDPRTGQPLPTPQALVDFECGDSILVLSSDGAHEEKVYSITMSFSNPESASIGLTLNDYFDSWEVQFDQRLRRLGG